LSVPDAFRRLVEGMAPGRFLADSLSGAIKVGPFRQKCLKSVTLNDFLTILGRFLGLERFKLLDSKNGGQPIINRELFLRTSLLLDDTLSLYLNGIPLSY